MLHRMSYRQAYLSALKYNFQNLIFMDRNNGSIPRHILNNYYKLAKYAAATYTFNMKSHDLTSIPVW